MTQPKGILILLSPAKTLDLSPLTSANFSHGADATAIVNAAIQMQNMPNAPNVPGVPSCDFLKTEMICTVMKKRSEGELRKFLGISGALGKTAYRYWSDFTLKPTPKNPPQIKPALFTFSGPVYQALSPLTCSTDTLNYLSNNLFILDPLYGITRCLDGIQPYRLEMGCKGVVDGSKTGKNATLAAFWKESVTSFLSKELISRRDGNVNDITGDKMKKSIKKSDLPEPSDDGPILANIASHEYFDVVNIYTLPRNTRLVNIMFYQKGRVVSTYAKRARGLMTRYLAENNASTLEDISKFDCEGYHVVKVGENGDQRWEKMSVLGDNVQVFKMIFDREDCPPTKAHPPKNSETKKKGAAKKETQKGNAKGKRKRVEVEESVDKNNKKQCS